MIDLHILQVHRPGARNEDTGAAATSAADAEGIDVQTLQNNGMPAWKNYP